MSRTIPHPDCGYCGNDDCKWCRNSGNLTPPPIGYRAIWVERLPLDKEWWDSTEDNSFAIRIFVPDDID